MESGQAVPGSVGRTPAPQAGPGPHDVRLGPPQGSARGRGCVSPGPDACCSAFRLRTEQGGHRPRQEGLLLLWHDRVHGARGGEPQGTHAECRLVVLRRAHGNGRPPPLRAPPRPPPVPSGGRDRAAPPHLDPRTASARPHRQARDRRSEGTQDRPSCSGSYGGAALSPLNVSVTSRTALPPHVQRNDPGPERGVRPLRVPGHVLVDRA